MTQTLHHLLTGARISRRYTSKDITFFTERERAYLATEDASSLSKSLTKPVKMPLDSVLVRSNVLDLTLHF
jgi:hypothetical protein